MFSNINAGRLRRLAGALLIAMAILAILHGLYSPFPMWPSGVAAWFAGALLLPQVTKNQKIQFGALAGLGFATLGVAWALGAQIAWLRILDANALLLTMLASVSFLRLVAIGGKTMTRRQDVGAVAYRQTLLGVAVFGAFINMSAPILIADQLTKDKPLSRFASQSVTRVFSGCSAWSPFFGGMAVVITYVDQADMLTMMMVGLPFAAIGFLVVIFEASWRYRTNVEAFEGYPLTLSGLWIPTLLVAGVCSGYLLLPSTSILIIIAIAALAVTAIILVSRYGTLQAARQMTMHVTSGLPAMVGELLLFIAAGILAVGLSALVATSHIPIQISNFTAQSASILLGAMVLISALGVHPIITIAALTPLLSPLQPNPVLLGVTYLFGWSLGTCASPLSGTHLVFQGRYGVPSTSAAKWNWPFASVMYLAGVALLHIAA